jgi:hypothetical protein
LSTTEKSSQKKICVKNKAWEIFMLLEFVLKKYKNKPSGFLCAKEL